jgi:hypothetical protein
MFRKLLLALALLHLGPGLAFALLAFGCDGTPPALTGGVCDGGGLGGFLWLTLLAWLLLGLGLAAWAALQRARNTPPPATAARLLALTGLLAEGALLAAAGHWLSGSTLWVLAVPALLAAGWLVLANPQACLPDSGRHGGGT